MSARKLHFGLVSAVGVVAAGAAGADTINPAEFSADLAVGESTTVEKTVTIERDGSTSAVLDSFFLFDTSGSMGAEINDAKSAASDIITELGGFGDSAVGVGVFAEGALDGIGDGTADDTTFNRDLTTDSTEITDAINDVTLGVPDGGGSFPESSNTAIQKATEAASWRPGSNRFMFVLGDASSNESVSDSDVTDTLADNFVNLVGLNFGSSSFANDITDLGGTVFDGGTSPGSLVDAITDGITAGFAEYEEVTVDDLGGGGSIIDVAVECLSAAGGTCNGALAEGDYDREEDRVFNFSVEFTRLADGDSTFKTHALVDGGIVASEKDSFVAAPIPVPAALPLLLTALGGLGLAGRRRRRASTA